MGTLIYNHDERKRMTHDLAHDKISQTYRGQAHIAGTGPDGITCRECLFFGKDKALDFEHFGHRKDCLNPGGLKEANCHKPWAGVHQQLFPHTALACSFFEQNNEPPLAVLPAPKKADTAA